MNFIVIVSDSLRRDHLGCYGNDWISTPHIDAFSKHCVVFDRAYVASFPTVPHRRDFLTGRFTATYVGWSPLGQRSTITAEHIPADPRPGVADEIVIPEILSEAGYVSMMIVDNPHILENGYHFDRGFDGFEWIRGQESDRWRTSPREPKYHCDPAKIRRRDRIQQRHRRAVANRRHESDTFPARTMNRATQWLEDNYQQDKFFLYVDTFDPHEPWDAPQWYVDMYNPGYTGDVVDYPQLAYVDGYLTDEELAHCRALYAAEITLVDRWVGTLFQKVEDLGLLENTMVIFMSDHGHLQGEHGIIGKALLWEQDEYFSYFPLYNDVNHIPFMVRYPGVAPRRSQAMIQPTDICPTIVDLANCADPGTMHGKSMSEVLLQGRDDHRAYTVSTPYIKSDPCPATIVKDPWAAILFPRRRTEERLVDPAVDGFDKLQVKSEFADQVQSEDMLFDMSKDPKQEHDVKDQHPEVMEELRADLVRRFEEVDTAKDIIDLWRL